VLRHTLGVPYRCIHKLIMLDRVAVGASGKLLFEGQLFGSGQSRTLPPHCPQSLCRRQRALHQSVASSLPFLCCCV